MIVLALKPRKTPTRIVRYGTSSHGLLVAFDAATPPVVWQTDLAKSAPFSFQLRGTEAGSDLVLVSDGNPRTLAHFTTREAAEESLQAVRTALFRQPREGSGWIRLAGTSLLIAAVLLVVLALLAQAGKARMERMGIMGATEETASSGPGTGPREVKPGVPVSADEVLQSPPP